MDFKGNPYGFLGSPLEFKGFLHRFLVYMSTGCYYGFLSGSLGEEWSSGEFLTGPLGSNGVQTEFIAHSLDVLEENW